MNFSLEKLGERRAEARTIHSLLSPPTTKRRRAQRGRGAECDEEVFYLTTGLFSSSRIFLRKQEPLFSFNILTERDKKLDLTSEFNEVAEGDLGGETCKVS